MYGEYSRYRVIDAPLTGAGPYEATVISHLDPLSMGTLLVELMKYNSSNGTPERSGQLITVRYLSPFYGVTPFSGLKPEDNYRSTQQSYGMWMVPPDQGTKVLVIYAEGNPAYAYWIGCIPDTGMNFMTPDPRASTTRTTGTVPENLQGSKLPVGEYNKTLVTGEEVDPTLYPKPYNNDFTQVLEVQGLLYDETRGTTTSSSRRETPSMVFGVSTPGPKDKRQGSPTAKYGAKNEKVDIPFSRLGGSSIVMDDGDERFVRATHAADGPPFYVNKELGESGGDETIPQNEGIRIRTRTGHQILMSNSEDLIYISNSRGTAWIELTSDGKIDIHADDSISLMTAGDFNVTAERDINMEAGRNVNIRADGRYADFQEKYFDNNIDDTIRNGQLTLESYSQSRISSGRNSTHFKFTENAMTIDIEKDLIFRTRNDLHMYAGGSIFKEAEETVHETAGVNWYRKAKNTMVDQCEDYYSQISNNSFVTIGNVAKESVESDKNIRVNGNFKTTIQGTNNIHSIGDSYILTDASQFLEAGAAINNTAGSNMYNDIAGNFNIQAGAFFSADASNIHLNSGLSNPGVPASAGITDGSDAQAFLTGNSPEQPHHPGRIDKLVKLRGEYIIPGEKFGIPYETIVPRAPQHEPWNQHENLDPISFKREFTDRERMGPLKNADRIITPDTFLKNRTGLQNSVVVNSSGGRGGFNVDGENRTGRSVVPTGPATGSTTPNVSYVSYFKSQTRNKPIQDRLMKILDIAARVAKVEVEIYSGGQDVKGQGTRRTGSRRHDGGYAADVWLYNGNKKPLNCTNSDDLGIMITFCRAAKNAGATAIGVGNGYMGNTGIHLDIAKGRPGVGNGYTWGGRSMNYAGAPQWIKDIMESKESRTPTNDIDQTGPQ